jgi:hypothetical protein
MAVPPVVSHRLTQLHEPSRRPLHCSTT